MSTNIEKMRAHARQIFEAGLQAVDPVAAINQYVVVNNNVLNIGQQQFNLKDYDRILIVGAGKASAPMAKAVEELLGDRISDGIIVT